MKCFYQLIFFLCFSLLIGCEGSIEPNDSKLAKEAGAPIFEGLGNHSHLITTEHEGAQRYFNQGLILAFGFNHAESIRSFKAAQKLDPTCGMCFWGEALATGPNINVTSSGKAVMSAEQRTGAFAAIQKAQDNSGHLTQNERDYIDALSRRYNGEPSTPRAPLDTSYAVAMEALKKNTLKIMMRRLFFLRL